MKGYHTRARNALARNGRKLKSTNVGGGAGRGVRSTYGVDIISIYYYILKLL